MPPIINSGPFEDQKALMIRNVLNEFLKLGKEFIKKENMLGHSIVMARPLFVSTLIGTSTSAWDRDPKVNGNIPVLESPNGPFRIR